MASRNFSNNGLAMERKFVSLWARIAIGATGAPTLQTLNRQTGAWAAAPSAGVAGIKSISRTSAGLYVLKLQDSYIGLLDFWVGFSKDTVPAAPQVFPNQTGTDVRSGTSPQITFTCYNNAGTATDPASGEVMFIEIDLTDSMAV